MTWQDIVNEPSLANLPYKIETNEFGQVIMSPTVFLRGVYQSKIAELLRQHLQSFTSLETALQTSRGSKVPDVVWRGIFFGASRCRRFADSSTDLCRNHL
jgi:hypothetical protein